jgi:hypothetical protein
LGAGHGLNSWVSGLLANACSITELSLMVPIVNTLAFLFTVLGEWWVERKVIGRGKFSYRFKSPCAIG